MNSEPLDEYHECADALSIMCL